MPHLSPIIWTFFPLLIFFITYVTLVSIHFHLISCFKVTMLVTPNTTTWSWK